MKKYSSATKHETNTSNTNSIFDQNLVDSRKGSRYVSEEIPEARESCLFAQLDPNEEELFPEDIHESNKPYLDINLIYFYLVGHRGQIKTWEKDSNYSQDDNIEMEYFEGALDDEKADQIMIQRKIDEQKRKQEAQQVNKPQQSEDEDGSDWSDSDKVSSKSSGSDKSTEPVSRITVNKDNTFVPAEVRKTIKTEEQSLVPTENIKTIAKNQQKEVTPAQTTQIPEPPIQSVNTLNDLLTQLCGAKIKEIKEGSIYIQTQDESKTFKLDSKDLLSEFKQEENDLGITEEDKKFLVQYVSLN